MYLKFNVFEMNTLENRFLFRKWCSVINNGTAFPISKTLQYRLETTPLVVTVMGLFSAGDTQGGIQIVSPEHVQGR